LREHLLAERDAIVGPSLLDVIVGRCPRWHAPGVLLLGDAAHPMSPIRAQGINMALRDAVVAANHLVPALSDGGSLDAAAAAIQREREPEVARAQTLQYREARGQRWARKQSWLMKPALALVPVMMRSTAIQGFIQKSWLRQQKPLRMGSREVRLRV
jgi:2-polyprenyl-6-methoxyphenol hydroxylase-like FAD-dependent oxidoreductase